MRTRGILQEEHQSFCIFLMNQIKLCNGKQRHSYWWDALRAYNPRNQDVTSDCRDKGSHVLKHTLAYLKCAHISKLVFSSQQGRREKCSDQLEPFGCCHINYHIGEHLVFSQIFPTEVFSSCLPILSVFFFPFCRCKNFSFQNGFMMKPPELILYI